jgi:hypothetical protein
MAQTFLHIFFNGIQRAERILAGDRKDSAIKSELRCESSKRPENTFRKGLRLPRAQFAWEINMSAVPRGEPFLQAEPIASPQRALMRNSNGLPSEQIMEGSPEEWQIRFQSLQQWICELLIKNQQLRMALMEVKAREPGDGRGAWSNWSSRIGL